MATAGVRRLRSVLELHKCGCRRFSTSHLFQKVGFIGLGNMGSRMADNLIKAGYDVAVHDINLDVMKRFSNKGIPTKESPLEIAEASDVVITMLPSSHHVHDVYTGPNGLLTGGNSVRPWLFIDSSTIDPQTSRNVFGAVSDCSLREKKDGQEAPSMLDAPVSGGVLAAETGSLTFMVGGSEEAYIAAKPLFLSMGKNSIYCGGSGNGSSQKRLNVSIENVFYAPNYLDRFISMNKCQTAKICNNLAMAVSMLGVSEAFALGQSLGVASSTLTKIFNSSSARCWSSDTYNPVPGVMDGVPSSRNYEGGFMSKLMLKDLNLAQTSVKNVGLRCPLTSQAEEIYAKLCNDGYEAKDFSCVFRYYYSGNDEQ